MKRSFRIWALAVGFGVLGIAASAQNTGLAFLKIGTDARGLAMGSANTASTSNVFSTYWNPAGLAESNTNSGGLSHHLWISDVRIYTLAGRFSAGPNGGFGVAVTAVGSGDIPLRSGPGDAQGVFSAQFVSTGLSYGRRFGPLSLGITGKYLVERIFEASAQGFAADAGALLHVSKDLLTLGVTMQHIGDMSRLGEVASELPKTLKAGIGVRPFHILLEDDKEDFLNTLVTVEWVKFLDDLVDESSELRFGIEAMVLETILARAGWRTNNELWRFSLGAGIEYDAFHFDYAFLSFRSGYGGSGHVLTLTYDW